MPKNCKATAARTGAPCGNQAAKGSVYCYAHKRKPASPKRRAVRARNVAVRALDPAAAKKIAARGWFETIDNGMEGYRVIIDDASSSVRIFKIDHPNEPPYRASDVATVWVGCGSYGDVMDGSGAGNTALLVQKHNRCIIIGAGVESFPLEPGEEVVRFFSTVNNSGVPYGFVETNIRYIGNVVNNCVNYQLFKSPTMPPPENYTLWCMESKTLPWRRIKTTRLVGRAFWASPSVSE